MTDVANLLTRFVLFTDKAGWRVLLMQKQRRVRKGEIREIVQEMTGLRDELNELLDPKDRA